MFSSKIIDFSDRVKNEGLTQELVYDFLKEIDYPNFKYFYDIITQHCNNEDERKEYIYEIIKECLSDEGFVNDIRDCYKDEKIDDTFISLIISLLMNKSYYLDQSNDSLTELPKGSRKKIFVCLPCIPSKKNPEGIVLLNDLMGDNSNVLCGKDRYSLTAPHGHKFIDSKSNDKYVAQLFLSYLDSIEKKLSNANLSEISTKHGTFKSEGKSSVMRDTIRKIRIQIIDYNPYVFYCGNIL